MALRDERPADLYRIHAWPDDDTLRGFKGIGQEFGQFIPADEASDYCLEQCGLSIQSQTAPMLDDAIEILCEWFYSGSWVRVEQPEWYGGGGI